jgi:RNA polymerase sigma-70 factor (ECF subfamily)
VIAVGGVDVVAAAPVDERAAFAELVRPHWGQLCALARRLAPSGDWEDALQEALSAAWRKRAQFDPARGTARNWLLAVVADQARKGFRRVRPRLELVDLPDTPRDSEADLDLRRALGRLTARQRTAVALHYYLGLPLADVADVMRCSTGTVKSTLSDARTRLRRELGEGYR